MRRPKARKSTRVIGRRRKTTPVRVLLGRYGRFLAACEMSPKTILHYSSDIALFARWWETETSECFAIGGVTSVDLRAYKRLLMERERLKPASINRKLASLKSVLAWAGSSGRVPALEAVRIPKRLPVSRPGPRWLAKKEQHALLRAVERRSQGRDLALVTLLLNTGLRVGELVGLTWKDVKVSQRKGVLVVRWGKGSKRREVPLNPDARWSLKLLGYARFAGRKRPVCLGQRGAMTARGIELMLDRYRVAARLDELSPHVLRHTFCKNLVDAGVRLEQVAALAGHESLEVTRRYCEPSFADLAGAVARIGETEE